jgi:hypothetical protein
MLHPHVADVACLVREFFEVGPRSYDREDRQSVQLCTSGAFEPHRRGQGVSFHDCIALCHRNLICSFTGLCGGTSRRSPHLILTALSLATECVNPCGCRGCVTDVFLFFRMSWKRMRKRRGTLRLPPICNESVVSSSCTTERSVRYECNACTRKTSIVQSLIRRAARCIIPVLAEMRSLNAYRLKDSYSFTQCEEEGM